MDFNAITLASRQIYFFLNELFLDIKSELGDSKEVDIEELLADDGTLSHKFSSVTIVMASCSLLALAIDRVTTWSKDHSWPLKKKKSPTVNLGDFDFLLLRRIAAGGLLEVSSLTSSKSAKVSSESAE